MFEDEKYIVAAISIGRNIPNSEGEGQIPMPPKSWEDFKARTLQAIKQIPRTTFYAKTEGKGEWYDKGFVTTEDTAIYLVRMPAEHKDGLQVMLAGLGYIYCQEGIGFTAAPESTTFVPSGPFGQAVTA